MSFEIVTLPSVPAWGQARRGSIGSSDASALWGVSPYASPRSVYESKVNGVEPDIDPDLAEWGHIVEPAVADFYRKKTGHVVQDPGANTFYRSTQWPWMAASLDRVVVNDDLEQMVLECKNRGGAGVRTWREEGDGAPMAVQIQVQHALAVTGWRRGIIGVALGGLPPQFIEVERDDEFLALHVEKCRAFWEEHVVKRVPPPVDGHEATTEALRRRFASFAGGKIVTLGDDAAKWHAELDEIKHKQEVLAEKRAELENRLRDAIGDAEVALLPGGGAYKLSRVKESTYTATRKAHTRMQFKANINVTFRKGA